MNEIDKKLEAFKYEIFEKLDISMNKRIAHIKSSPETIEKLRILEETNKLQNTQMEKMALQVNEMYTIFTSTNFMLKFTIRVFGAIGIITGGVIGVIELLKRSK